MRNRVTTYKAPGNISIFRRDGEKRRSVILQVEDGVSGCLLLEFEMSCESFAEALTGLSYSKGNLEVYLGALEKLGMREIRKSVIVPITKDDLDSLRRIHREHGGLGGLLPEEDLKVYEISKRVSGSLAQDDWKMSLSDLVNPHNIVTYGNDITPTYVRVTFSKWVSSGEADAWEEAVKKGQKGVK